MKVEHDEVVASLHARYSPHMVSLRLFALARGLALALLLAFVPWRASAQTPGPEGEPTMDDISSARTLFAEGATAAEEGRWSDALSAFRESYRLSGIAAALYNTATTYRSLGRYRLARDTFDQLLEEHHDLSEEMSSSARGLREEVAARVAVLELAGLPEETVEIRLDGRARPDDGERPQSLDVDEGEHRLQVEQSGYVPFEWTGSVSGGDRQRIDVQLEERPSSGPNVLRIVLITTAVVAVVAGGVALGFVLREEELQPESNNVVRLP